MKALVTGATGFVGSYLIRALLHRGDSVRILARTAERGAALQSAGAEVCLGDLAEPNSFVGIAEGMDTVFHLARSPTSASVDVFRRIDVQGTEQLLIEAERAQVRRFVYASTLAGFPLADKRDGAVIDERCPIDESGLLGNYVRAKARAEGAVLAANSTGRIEGVIIRLGLVCGVGTNVLPAHVCQPVGPNWAILFGDGNVLLPLTYIDNAVDALILGATVPGIGGEIFHIVDDEALTQQEYLAGLRRLANGSPRVVRLPRIAYYAVGVLSEIAAAARRKEPATTRYRIRTRLKGVQWDCSKAKGKLRWRTRVPLEEGLLNTFRAYASARNASGRQQPDPPAQNSSSSR
jgi:nucleoside-diphosphate-sugar epimerase